MQTIDVPLTYTFSFHEIIIAAITFILYQVIILSSLDRFLSEYVQHLLLNLFQLVFHLDHDNLHF